MKDKIKNVAIALLCLLSVALAYRVDTLEFELETYPIKQQIRECLNSSEAKATERFNQNVRDAINERRVQEAGVCED